MYKSVIHRKYKGGILLLAVFISVVISVFCGAIVLMFYYLNSNAERFLISDSLKDEAESAIILALNDIKNSEDNYVLYDGFQTTIKTAPWGIYTMLHVKSKFKLDSIVKVVLVGNKRESFENNALILSNPTQDLHVCGNVVIKGLCHLPKTTIKKVTIEGRNPEKIEISNDKIISSIVSFPDVSEEVFYPIKYFFYQRNDFSDFKTAEFVLKEDSIINSFHNKTMYLYTNDKLYIKNKKIYGNIFIISDEEIIIEDCDVKDIILVSERIKILNVQESNLQAYANGEIIVGQKSQLIYPSSLVIYNNKDDNDNINITISDSSFVYGSILLRSENKKNAKISLEKGTLIEGLVYSTTYVELKGSVYGGVYSSKLYYKTKNNNYENLLMDASINSYLLSDYFIGPDFNSSISRKEVVKCLD